MKEPLEKHFYYWILPSFVILTIGLLYFTGIPAIQEFIAPEANRELGLLESIQHLILVTIVYLAMQGWRKADPGLEKLGYGLATALATFQLMEEVNYGQHYLNALAGYRKFGPEGPWSLHNQENVSTQLKRVGDVVIFFFFFLFPLVVREKWPAWVRFLAPPRLITMAVLFSVIVTKSLHYVSDNSPFQNVLINAVSEFRELFIYYFVLLYVHELTTHRRWPGLTARNAPIPRTGGANFRGGT